jgi:hypothetical protein
VWVRLLLLLRLLQLLQPRRRQRSRSLTEVDSRVARTLLTGRLVKRLVRQW